MPIRSCHFRFGCLFIFIFKLHCAGWNCGRERSKLWTRGNSMTGIFVAAELGCSVSHRKMWFGPAWPLAVWVCYSKLFCSIWFKLFLLYSHTLFQSTHTHTRTHARTHARTHTHLVILPAYFLTILLSLLIPPSLPSLASPLFLLSSLSHSLHPIIFFPPSFLHPPSLYILYILVPSTPLFLPPFLSSIPLYFYLLLPLSSSFLFYYPAPISLLHSIIPPSLPALSSLLCHQLYIVTRTPPPL